LFRATESLSVEPTYLIAKSNARIIIWDIALSSIPEIISLAILVNEPYTHITMLNAVVRKLRTDHYVIMIQVKHLANLHFGC